MSQINHHVYTPIELFANWQNSRNHKRFKTENTTHFQQINDRIENDLRRQIRANNKSKYNKSSSVASSAMAGQGWHM